MHYSTSMFFCVEAEKGIEIEKERKRKIVPYLLFMNLVCIVCMVITYGKGKDQPGKVANPARGQPNKENDFFPVPVRA